MKRTFFPHNLHSIFAGSTEGVSKNTKTSMGRLLVVFFLGVFSFLGHYLMSDLDLGFLGVIVGFAVGALLSLYVWNKFFIDHRSEKFENSKENKIYKFVKVSFGYNKDDKEYIGDAEMYRHETGHRGIAFSVSIGNQTDEGKETTQEFLDDMINFFSHQNQEFDITITKDSWEGSNMQKRQLKRIAKSHDKKLKDTLIKIDIHQSKIVENSNVQRMTFCLSATGRKSTVLGESYTYVSKWFEEKGKYSSVRDIQWLHGKDLVQVFCQYLGTRTLDISPNANPNQRVSLDTRQMAYVHRSEGFDTHLPTHKRAVDIQAVMTRKPKENR